MDCYYHGGVEAVGVCTRCGRAGCRACLQDVGGGLVCRECLGLAQRQRQQRASVEAHQAQRRILYSWILGCLGALLFGLFIYTRMRAYPQQAGVLAAFSTAVMVSVIYFYAFWSGYWGLVWLWDQLKSSAQQHPVVLIMPISYWLFMLLVGWIIAGSYGLLGGGIYQHFKHRRIAHHRP